MNSNKPKKSNKKKSNQKEFDWTKYDSVVFIDEVWRWSLAWDLVVCCLSWDINCYVNDSKKLSAKKREQIFSQLQNENIKYALASSTPAFIDKNGLTKAMKATVLKWIKKLGYKIWDNILLVLDWKFGFGLEKYFDVQTIIWWDWLVPQIWAASIIAKVTRDEKMKKLSKKFPQYMREKNVGYGSWAHRQAIKKFWLTKHHRKSFCKNFN